jgi:hypothetical protein
MQLKLVFYPHYDQYILAVGSRFSVNPAGLFVVVASDRKPVSYAVFRRRSEWPYHEDNLIGSENYNSLEGVDVSSWYSRQTSSFALRAFSEWRAKTSSLIRGYITIFRTSEPLKFFRNADWASGASPFLCELCTFLIIDFQERVLGKARFWYPATQKCSSGWSCIGEIQESTSDLRVRHIASSKPLKREANLPEYFYYVGICSRGSSLRILLAYVWEKTESQFSRVRSETF